MLNQSKKEGISIVIVSWNTKTVTDKCLSNIQKAKEFTDGLADTEVVVVDNDSSDGSPEMIKKKYPWVKLIKSGSNLGYAKGNNLGFKKTNPKNKFLLLLNSDAYIKYDTLVGCLNFYKDHPDCDVLGCKLLSENGKMQPSAGYLPTPFSVWTWFWGIDLIPVVNILYKQFHPRFSSFFRKEKRVGWAQGAFLFMRRVVFEKTNGFDENFFLYMDEVEWFRRVKSFGYNIFYTPKFSVTHLDRASSHGIPEKLAKVYVLEALGLVYYLKKYYPGNIGFLLPLLKLGAILRRFAFLLLGKKTRSEAYMQIYKEI